MKVLFDTSVLIAALIETHPHHERAFLHFDRARVGEVAMVVSAHTLAEVYSTLTALPIKPKITPRQARQTIREEVLSVAEVVALGATDYEAVLARMADLGLMNGAVYDGLHVHAAEKIEADELLTCNGRDFRQMPPEPPTRLVVV